MKWGIVVLLAVLIFGGCHEGHPDAKAALSKEELTEAAKQFISSFGLLGSAEARIAYDEENEQWRKYFAWLSEEDDTALKEQAEDARLLLKDRDYQAFCVDGGPGYMGGPWWLLLDPGCGEPILLVEEFWRAD